MKKIFVFLCLLTPLSALAVDDLGLKVPEWKDYAPSAFVDVQEPKRLGKFNLILRYWYQRRVDFEAGLEECTAIGGYQERFSCYETLKIKQFKENSEYNARIEARQNAASGIPEMNSRTDTMFPINNYVNNFGRFQANEIR